MNLLLVTCIALFISEVLSECRRNLLQAAYQELTAEERPAVHLRVGRRLLGGMSAAQYEEHAFAVLHHFNQALPLITDPVERLRLSHANLAAGQTFFRWGLFMFPALVSAPWCK